MGHGETTTKLSALLAIFRRNNNTHVEYGPFGVEIASNTHWVPKYQNSNPLFVLLPNTQSNITTWRLKCLFYGLFFSSLCISRSLSLSAIYYLDMAFNQNLRQRRRTEKKIALLSHRNVIQDKAEVMMLGPLCTIFFRHLSSQHFHSLRNSSQFGHFTVSVLQRKYPHNWLVWKKCGKRKCVKKRVAMRMLCLRWDGMGLDRRYEGQHTKCFFSVNNALMWFKRVQIVFYFIFFFHFPFWQQSPFRFLMVCVDVDFFMTTGSKLIAK